MIRFANVVCFMIMLLVLTGPAPAVRAASGTPASGATGDTGTWLHFYKTIVSATDGERCPMYPSCSTYASRAFKKHGFFMGWILTCDRLIRCGRDETRLSPHLRSGNRVLTVDTLEDNDFWWYSGPSFTDFIYPLSKGAWD